MNTANRVVLDDVGLVWWCTFSPSSELVSIVFNNKIKVWDSRTSDINHLIDVGLHDGIGSIHSHSKPKLAKKHVGTNTVEILDTFTGSCIYTLRMGRIITGALSPDSVHMAVMTDTDTDKWIYHLDIWNVLTGTRVSTIHKYFKDWYHRDGAYCCYSLDGLLLVESCCSDSIARVWNVADGACVCTLGGHGSRVCGAVFSPRDATLIATTSLDSSIKLWHARTRVCLDPLIGHASDVTKCVFSPDGGYLATISNDTTIKIWNVYTGTCVHTIHWRGPMVSSCDFSFDGSMLVTSNYESACIWQLPSWLRNNVKLLLLIIVSNRHRRPWLPTELWDWMNEQWFFYH